MSGYLDTSFGTNGRASASGNFSITGGVGLADGKLVIVSTLNSSQGRILRFNDDGTKDGTFGGSSGLLLDSSTSGGLLQLPDGSYLVGGEDDNNDLVLLRVSADGQLDASFGVAGRLTIALPNSGIPLTLQQMVRRADGSIIVLGVRGPSVVNSMSVFRVSPALTLDTEFGSAGEAHIDLSLSFDTAAALAVQPDGNIVVGGSRAFTFDQSEMLLARLDGTTGDLDPTFGIGGVVTRDVGMTQHEKLLDGIALQDGGAIVAVGSQDVGNSVDILIRRYLSDGSLDAAFGTGGEVTIDIERRLDSSSSVDIGRIARSLSASDQIVDYSVRPERSSTPPSFGASPSSAPPRDVFVSQRTMSV
jgi:uncharacterized delta-60 repeat protein